MNLPLSPGAAKALALLQAAGYEAWIVGGCVRDALLGLPPKDYDPVSYTHLRAHET